MHFPNARLSIPSHSPDTRLLVYTTHDRTSQHDSPSHSSHNQTGSLLAAPPPASLNLNPLIMLIQDGNTLLQSLQPRLQLLLDQFLIITKLLVECISVRTRLHGKGEHWTNHHAVVLLECAFVGFGKGVGELFGAVGVVFT